MKPSRTWIAIVLAVLVFASSGCGVISRIRAKNQLNEAAIAYRDNHLEEAEQHARRALELDPTNKTAPLFIARIVHKQFKHGVNTPENTAKANEAINLYKGILQNDPKNDEAYKAVADLMGQLHQDKAQRDWISQRAEDVNADQDKRAEAYIILASKDWSCSNVITEANKTTTVDPATRKATVSYKKPKDDKEFIQAKKCVESGLAEIENAIKQDAHSEPAWSFKTNLLIQASALAEMDGKMDQKAELEKQRAAADKRTAELNAENQKKKAEEDAKKAPSPPAG
jgi:hypothetical protein